MAETKIKAGQFSGIVGHGTDGYFLMTNGDGTMAWAEGGATGPSVTSVSYPGDDLAADPTGGQTVVLTGTGFAASGMTVSIGGTTAPSVAHDSNTQLTITTPAKAAGDYDIVVTNTVTGASGTFVNGISYNGIPTWTTVAGSLGAFDSETTISTITLQATEPDGGTITFNITNGALPTGLSLTGANIDGTTTAESSTTLYSFTIEAIDDENQSTPRNFSITVNAPFLNTDNFGIVTYTGTNNSTSVSISSLDFQPDLIIHKCRNDGWSHWVYDSIRGTGGNAELQTNSTAAEGGSNNETYGSLGSFDSNGFTSAVGVNDGQYFNGSGKDFVAWCWKAGGTAVSNPEGNTTSQISANPEAGFSIITHTSAMLNTNTFGHGLNKEPDLIITKITNLSDNWIVHFPSILGNNTGLHLNTNQDAFSTIVYSGNSTTFNMQWTSSSYDFLHYCFADVDGYQKVGSYSGLGATNVTVTLGFSPRFVLIKRATGGNGNWVMYDNLRQTGTVPYDNYTILLADSSYQEQADNTIRGIQFTSTGFVLNKDYVLTNSSGSEYIYLAIA